MPPFTHGFGVRNEAAATGMPIFVKVEGSDASVTEPLKNAGESRIGSISTSVRK